jgi:hypothetical protein
MTTSLLYVIARRRWRWSRPRASIVAARVSDRRARVPRRQRAESAPWRLGSPGDRGGHLPRHDDVAPGSADPDTGAERPVDAAREVLRPGRAPAPASRPRHRRLPDRAHERDPGGSRAPPPVTTRRCTSTSSSCRSCSEDIPEVSEDHRLKVEPLPHGFFRVIARYGFMETPNVASVVARCCTDTLRSSGTTSRTISAGRR